jgi:hypothetical protein
MPKRPTPEDPEREQRITDEIVVDAYGPEEQAMGWYYYLEGHLPFPFRARCTRARATSPLREGEVTTVVRMAPEGDCRSDMLVIIAWGERSLGVPLAQLEGVDVGEDAAQAIADWHYWVEQGYGF